MADTSAPHTLQDLVGSSREMREVRFLIREAAETDMNILILGETGVGKEKVAEAIHRLSKIQSGRNGEYIKVNCPAIPENLFESMFFGYSRGAYTTAHSNGNPGIFRLAEKGTVYLDEFMNLAPHLHAKLLRVLREKEIHVIGTPKQQKVDVKIISATNRNLEEEMRRGKLELDFYYRISGFPIYVPPLRERKEDIQDLVDHFIRKYNHYGLRITGISEEVMELFMKHSWPGNAGELDNYIRRAIASAKRIQEIQGKKGLEIIMGISYFKDFAEQNSRNGGGAQQIGDTYGRHAEIHGPYMERGEEALFQLHGGNNGLQKPLTLQDIYKLGLKQVGLRGKQDAERMALGMVLDDVHWNRLEATRRLKISYKALLYKIEQCGLNSEPSTGDGPSASPKPT